MQNIAFHSEILKKRMPDALKHLYFKLNRRGALSVSFFTFIAVQLIPTNTQNTLT